MKRAIYGPRKTTSLGEIVLGQFHGAVVTDQDVSSSQVTMGEVFLREVVLKADKRTYVCNCVPATDIAKAILYVGMYI